ncbi:hypothetical protein LP037_078 [Listeria phage LP-037]|uniref:Uncharacterized protein n=7 Tax=Homburgvirus TaxID=1921125 RepID=A0A6C0R014_9CAUD|nr:hypothetical protein P70_00109 [Listeria phage P70]YP_008240556.1 hypothetical protein LP037_078 [Listeria phage LP-037]YP_009045142.1 hypothetical protein LP114_088 [Listeria phage LP-114]QDK04606.1 hypothetical protein FK481_0092 [Listeria phage LP-010]QDK04717.1 hypothetical protein FK482_0095 [Listeria phage LP-013]QDK04830.1 hypothetical protein FK484_0097 [Listeria phage LP-031]QHZ59439.1 hypothetical protein FK483_0096 [Listeria phage LP-018]AFQ96298.1 hypothetical protein P70_0010
MEELGYLIDSICNRVLLDIKLVEDNKFDCSCLITFWSETCGTINTFRFSNSDTILRALFYVNYRKDKAQIGHEFTASRRGAFVIETT